MRFVPARNRLLATASIVVFLPFNPCTADEPAGNRVQQEPAALERLLEDYKAATERGVKRKVVEEIRRLGPDAESRLMSLLASELEDGLNEYGDQFAKAAVAIVEAKHRAAGETTIRRLQEQMLNSQDGAEILAAQRKLSRLLYPTRAEVFAHDASLAARRDKISGESTSWRRLARQSVGQLLKPYEEAGYLRALVSDSDASSVIRTNNNMANTMSPDDFDGIRLSNKMRVLAGLWPLEIDPLLCAAASDHAEDMVRLRFFSHDSLVEGKRKYFERARNFGTTANAENIAAVGSVRSAIFAWLRSTAHRDFLLHRDWKRIGFGACIGKKDRRFVQMFGY